MSSGPFSSRVGRRRTILLLSLVFIVGTLGCCLAPNVWALIVARFILGLAVGGASVTVPTYLAEVAPPGGRSRLVTRNELMIVGGGTQILTDSGFGRDGAFIANISNGVISVLATFLGIWLLPKIDRRTMLTVGICGIIATLVLIGVFSRILPPSEARAFTILPLMAAFLAFQQAFVSPVTWVLLSEIFPQKVRAFAISISGLALWLATFSVGFLFPIMTAAVGLSVTYFIFAAVNVVNLGFTRRFVPETRGKSLEEVEAMLRPKHPAS